MNYILFISTTYTSVSLCVIPSLSKTPSQPIHLSNSTPATCKRPMQLERRSTTLVDLGRMSPGSSPVVPVQASWSNTLSSLESFTEAAKRGVVVHLGHTALTASQVPSHPGCILTDGYSVYCRNPAVHDISISRSRYPWGSRLCAVCRSEVVTMLTTSSRRCQAGICAVLHSVGLNATQRKPRVHSW